MPYSFASDPRLPQKLKERLNEWRTSAPRSQYQQYGPLNMYLTCKFAAESFIVKPQAMLRKILEIPANLDKEEVDALLDQVPEDDMVLDEDDISAVKTAMGLRHKATLSIDSTGMPVLSETTVKKYPDFVVTVYRDLIPQRKNAPPRDERLRLGPDAVRLIVEVASELGRSELSPQEVHKLSLQIIQYLKTLGKEGKRWEGYVAGIVISGNDCFFVEPNRKGNFTLVNSVEWFDLNSDKFIEIINKAVNLNSRF